MNWPIGATFTYKSSYGSSKWIGEVESFSTDNDGIAGVTSTKGVLYPIREIILETKEEFLSRMRDEKLKKIRIMKLIKDIIKSIGIVIWLRSIFKIHIHKWEYGRHFNFRSRWCSSCGRKQIYGNDGWLNWKPTKEEMRDFKLNKLLKK